LPVSLRSPADRQTTWCAAVCAAPEATLTTRNTSDFTGTGIVLVNPWPGLPSVAGPPATRRGRSRAAPELAGGAEKL